MGKILPNSFSLRYLSRLPQFNAWLKRYIGEQCPKFSVREELYTHVYDKYIHGARLDYFEMGVWYGAAIKSWTQLDSNEDSSYYGFDTFEGLPEVWEGLTANAEVGTFNVGGSMDNVNIVDDRVTLIKGLFQDTVPGFLASTDLSQSDIRLLHIDSDLYSSALFCLSKFDHIIKQNDIIVFDELSSMDEFWALTDYATAFRREYKVLGHAGDYYQCVVIQML
jgi:hypothetical protein